MNSNKKKTDDIYTYLKFRGDLDLKNYPLNEVDALIFSELSYIQFENIVPTVEEKGTITLAEAAEKYIPKEGKVSIFYARYEKLLAALAECPRYAELQLFNYVSVTDLEEKQQFSYTRYDSCFSRNYHPINRNCISYSGKQHPWR